MIRVRFIATNGTATDAQGTAGARLLDVAQAAGQPLEGTCDGALACATCHVIVDPADAARLAPASSEEEDLLDGLDDRAPTSRLACQIPFDARLDGLRVTIGAEA